MAMQAMTTMALLGALNAGALNPAASHAAVPLTGVTSPGAEERTPFAAMLAKAGVSSGTVVPQEIPQATKSPAVNSTKGPEIAMRPGPAGTPAAQPVAITAEASPAVAVDTPHVQLVQAGVDGRTNIPLESSDPCAITTEARPAVTARQVESSRATFELPATPLIGAGPAAAVVVASSNAPAVSDAVVAPTNPHLVAVVPEAFASGGAPHARDPIAAPETVALAGAPIASAPAAVPHLPDEATVPDPPTVALAQALSVSAAPPETPAIVFTTDVPVVVAAPKAPIGRTSIAKVTEAVETKTARGTKAHSSVAARPEKKVTDMSAPVAARVEPGVNPVADVLAQASISQPAPHPTHEALLSPDSLVATAEPVGAVSLNQPLAAGPATSGRQNVPRIEEPATETGLAPLAVSVDQDHPLVIAATPPSATVAKAIHKLTSEGNKPVLQRPVRGALNAFPTHATSTSVAISSSTPSMATASPGITVHPSVDAHPGSPDTGVVVASAQQSVTAVAPIVPAVQTTHAGVTHVAPSVDLLPGPVSSQPIESPAPALPVLGHTTLNASPTVLEVGVPGGSHGWLKIRAEMGEGGSVQASLSAATPAGHETLHRELPEMTAFLAKEQLTVQLHVAAPPPSSAANAGVESEFARASAGPEQRGGERREPAYQEPAATPSSALMDGPEQAWASSDYSASTVLHGGSWVNVVA